MLCCLRGMLALLGITLSLGILSFLLFGLGGVLAAAGGLGALYIGLGDGGGMLRKGDFSCPPKGPGVFLSVGREIEPKGLTPSWTFSQLPSVGACGGLLGFHFTSVFFVIPPPGVVAISLDPKSLSFVVWYADCAVGFVLTFWEIGYFVSWAYDGAGDKERSCCRDSRFDLRLDDFLCRLIKKYMRIVIRAEAIMLPTMARAAWVAVTAAL